jgi:thiamine kinase-like enzyme
VVLLDGGPDQPGGAKYVMRIPGDGTDIFIDREREHLNHVAAAAAGVTPPLLYTLEPEKCTVVPFIEGETMHPETLAGNRERLGKVVDVIRAYHDKAAFANQIRVFDMIRQYMDMARDVDAPLPADIDWMLRLSDKIEQAMSRNVPRPVACHNDLLSENFILDQAGKMWVIDWEYGGMTDPYFDLGDFVMEHPFSREEERLIIAAYCGAMNESAFGRMMLYKIVSAVWWAVWAMIQHTVSKIDFDYMEWGMERVARAERGVADPDYRRWLAEA